MGGSAQEGSSLLTIRASGGVSKPHDGPTGSALALRRQDDRRRRYPTTFRVDRHVQRRADRWRVRDGEVAPRIALAWFLAAE
jgi:hypothetical protein